MQLGGHSFNTIQLTFLRFLIGGIFLLPLALRDLKRRGYRLSGSDIGYLILLGIICVCISMTLCQIGIMQTNASLAALVVSINPVFTMVFAHFLVNERFTWRKLGILLICVSGLIVAAGPDKLLSGNHIGGLLIVLAGSAAFGLYTALGKKRIAAIGGMAQNCFSFLFGCAGLLIILLLTGTPILAGISFSSLPILLYLGIVVTGLGYFAFLKAVAIGGASTASIAFFIKPVIATLAAFLLLREPITAHMLVGIALVLVGFTINILPQKTEKRSSHYGTENC